MSRRTPDKTTTLLIDHRDDEGLLSISTEAFFEESRDRSAYCSRD